MFMLEEIPLLAHACVYSHTLYKVLIHYDQTFKSYHLSTSSRKRKLQDKKKLHPTNSKYK